MIDLTPRELEAVKLLAAGGIYKTMADKMGISERTVRAHIESSMEKLGAINRPNLVYLALYNGVIEPQ